MSITSTAPHQSMVSRWLTKLGPVLVVIPIFCFSLLLVAYVVDVPWMDDIDAFLSFILGYTDAHTISEKLDWLLRPNNEHRILTGKLITLGLYKLTGTVNFRWLIWAAYLFLLGLLFVFYRVFRTTNLPLVAFVPVPFLLLQPQYYLTTTWAITSLQHQVVVAMIVATLYLLANGSQGRFVGGLALQVLTSLSMSNGLFGWVAGAVVLALQRHWLRLAVWLGLGIVTILFYFHDFQNTQGNDSSVSFFLKYPYLIVLGFFTFTGGLFDFFSNMPIIWRSVLPTLAGLVLIPTMLYWLWRMNEPLLRKRSAVGIPQNREMTLLQQRRYFLTGCYTFLMVNAVIVAFLRPRFGYAVMLISNYMLYPALLVILLYLTVLSEQYRNGRIINHWVRFGLVGSLIVWGVWYGLRLPTIAYRKQQLLTNAFNQKHNALGLGPSWGSPFVELARRSLGESVRRGIYQYPDAYFTPYEPALLNMTPTRPADPALDLRVIGGGYSYLTETGYNALPQPVRQSAIVVQSDRQTYLFPSSVPFSWTNFYLNRPVRTIQAEVVIPMLTPGTYQLGILTPTDTEENAIRFSKQTITVP